MGIGKRAQIHEDVAAPRSTGWARRSLRSRTRARRNLHDGTLVLYDVSSSYVEVCCRPLARFGHTRDHRSDKMQIVYRLLYAHDARSSGTHRPMQDYQAAVLAVSGISGTGDR